ncbi:MAG: UDP-N-acetylglucosamine 2-epimerase (non-hydrolyzing) [Candidatus Omnitrophica bacterium]|nr:UDP-N-acetylglucosamine 2-epimerase (non-hydrolyzing) [Candidatus Omnitrophota bacterium]
MRVVIVAGARPNLMKASPLIEAARRHKEIEYYLVYTGQHYHRLMSKVFWKDLRLPAPYTDLGAGSASHAVQTARVMVGFEKVCLRLRPDIIMVVGDVNSTLAAALVGAKLGIKVAHVEAGLRSFDRAMPEEINRILTDHLSDYLFVTEESALKNLKKEGIDRRKIYYTGNVMIDTLARFRKKAKNSGILKRLGLERQKIKYALLTLHRPSNVDDKLTFKRLIAALSRLSKRITIIFPVHPRTQKLLKEFGFQINKNRINCIDPLSYIDFIKLMSQAQFVLTDSGGIQEESTFLGVPCLTIRKNTERPVTIKEGTNKLVGSSADKIIREAGKILNSKIKIKKRRLPKFWDARAAERIMNVIASPLGARNDDGIRRQ